INDSSDPEAEQVSQPEWPENGEEWSDGGEEDDEGTGMDCGLLQAMAEEDEEINVHNEETFGMELDSHGTTEDSSSGGLLQFREPPPPPPDPKPPARHSSPFPPRQMYVPRAGPGQCGRGRGHRRGLGRGQMFEDPAVMRIVQGRPSLKVTQSYFVCENTTHSTFSSFDLFAFSGQYVVLNQTGAFMFPMSRPCPSTPQSLTPKMMQLRFGASSPRQSPFYSSTSDSVQYPGPVTQLHPQHKRLLSQKQRIFPRKPDGWDPYCNLMTAKEKEWITRLQMIQLQSEHPYLEDYYYQEYYRRIEAKMAEEELGIRGKREPPKLTTLYITKTDSYTPVVHIEGSLGQVAVSTCYSPRRAISAVHGEQKDNRQQRLEVLSKIEKLFIVLLEVEETDRMKTAVLSEAEERKLMEETQKKVEHIYSQMQHHNPLDTGGEFLPFLLVSKGKRLLSRLLPFLKNDAALEMLRIVTSNLPTLMSRDTEEALPVLYPPFRNVIGGLTFSQLIKVLKDLTSDSLTLACQNKRSSRIDNSVAVVFRTDTIFQVAGQLSQCSLVEPLLLPSNLLTLFCRYLDKHTVHQLKSNMESATGFLALPS
uniref:mRNA decay factor PAT1 domain-containing protein n=1 Tax=Mola mola TaxID=94237 RepID=A0A3Q3VM31_MOLML